jgi:hypothetical protein
MAIDSIKITLTNGQKYKLRSPETISEIDRSRLAIFVFDNLHVYEGMSNGEVDDDGDFAIFKEGSKIGAGLPYIRLVGWAYKRKGKV